jgi:hypothetical protein
MSDADSGQPDDAEAAEDQPEAEEAPEAADRSNPPDAHADHDSNEPSDRAAPDQEGDPEARDDHAADSSERQPEEAPTSFALADFDFEQTDSHGRDDPEEANEPSAPDDNPPDAERHDRAAMDLDFEDDDAQADAKETGGDAELQSDDGAQPNSDEAERDDSAEVSEGGAIHDDFENTEPPPDVRPHSGGSVPDGGEAAPANDDFEDGQSVREARPAKDSFGAADSVSASLDTPRRPTTTPRSERLSLRRLRAPLYPVSQPRPGRSAPSSPRGGARRRVL